MIGPVNVLLIEDNPGDACLVQEGLREADSRTNIRVQWVDCLEKALEHLATNPIQAVLVDLSLPDSEGIETLQRVLSCVPQLPVIVMTDQDDEDLGLSAMQAGAQDYLIKGWVDGRLLTRAIQYAIQRKQTELELADALGFNERMVVSSPVGIFTYRLTGECLSANAAAAQMVGATIEQLKSQNFHQIESWKRSGLYEMARRAIASKTPVADDVHIHTSFGREAWYQVQLVTFKSGGEELLLMTSADVTERRRAEQALQASERFNRATLDALTANIAILNESGTIIAVNHSWRAFAQANGADPVLVSEGANYLTVCHQATGKDVEAASQAAAGIRAVIQGEIETFTLEYPCHSPAEKRWFIARVTKFQSEGPLRIVVTHEYSTERKLAEEELRESEENYRQLFEAESDAILLIENETGKIIQANNAACFLYGYSQEELLIKRNIDLSAEPEQTQQGTKETPVRADQVVKIPLRFHRKKNGEVFPVEITGRFFVHHGRPVHIAAIRDITERRRAEAALEASEKRFRTWIENSSDLVSVVDLCGVIQYQSPSTKRVLGYAHEEILGLRVADLLHPEDQQNLAGLLAEIIQNPEGSSSVECRVRHRDGSWRFIEAVGRTFVDEYGEVMALINSRDITDRKQAEAALKASEQRYRDLAENFPNGVVSVYNRDLKLVFDAGLELKESGYTAEDFLGKHFSKIAPPETWENARPHLEAAFEGKVSGYEAPGLDGQYYRVNVAPLHDSEGEITEILVVSQNITSLKKTELALREKEHLLSEAQRIGQIGSWSYDIASDGLSFSDAMYHLLDILPEEFDHTTRDFLALVYPSDRPTATEWLEDVKAGFQVRALDFRLFRKNGELRYLHCEGAVSVYDNGKPARFIGMVQDITYRRVAEMQIEQQIRRLTALAEIDRAIISSFDRSYTLGVIVSQVISQLHVDAASVLVLEPDCQTLSYAAGQGFRTKMIETAHFTIHTDYAGRVAKERRMIRVTDLRETTLNPAFDAFVGEEGFVSYIGVPLMVKGVIKGVLEVFQRTLLQPYHEWLDFFHTLAGQAAIALENAVLFGNLQATNQELAQAYDATIEGWSRAMDLRDRETEGHTQRVTNLSLELARALGIEESRLVHLRRGALLHDIGKLGVPDQILFKAGELAPEEWEIMQKHAELAYQMLAPIEYLKPALGIPLCHHEKWDGTGYPLGLEGEQIPFEARIFAIVDVWDALRSDRPYRQAWSREKALDYICGQSGKHFDPAVVQCFLKIIEDRP